MTVSQAEITFTLLSLSTIILLGCSSTSSDGGVTPIGHISDSRCTTSKILGKWSTANSANPNHNMCFWTFFQDGSIQVNENANCGWKPSNFELVRKYSKPLKANLDIKISYGKNLHTHSTCKITGDTMHNGGGLENGGISFKRVR